MLAVEDLERERDRRRVLRSFAEFLPLWHFVNREDGGIHTFEDLWEGQREFARLMETERWILALKAGKLGFTELECAFDAWRALGNVNARVHIFSRDFAAAQELLDYVRFGLSHLPAWLAPTIMANERGGDTGYSLMFRMDTDDVRMIRAYAAGPNVSIEQSCIHAHVDELARMPFGETTWEAVNSTVAPGGTCHIVSRGAGDNNILATLWAAAQERMNEFVPLFCDYMKRPGRDRAWREAQGAKMTLRGLRFFAPETAEDALSGEDVVPFIPVELWRACKEDLPPFLPSKEPVVLGVDAASTGDCFAIVAITRHPSRHDDVALRAARKWSPPKHGAIDYTEPESFIRALCRGGCAAGHSQEDGFRQEGCAACQSGPYLPGFNVVKIAYDPYQLVDMMQRLQRDIGVWCEPISQGSPMAVAARQFLDLVTQKRIAHTGLLEMEEHIVNARAKLQANEDSKLRIVKKAPDKKIDLVVAAAMASYECLRLLI